MRPLGAADPKTIGPYQLLGVLGSGGMGRVYLGASRTGRRVAIKVIRPDLAEDPIFRDRFTREVAAAGRVSPLFTALVVDSDTEAAAPWLATTYIEGVSLDRHVLDDGAMGIDDVLSLAAGLGEALTSIHTVGLVHRDLKPSNILLNDSGPHIIDFGLALGSEQTRLTTSRVVGTPAYMAPERLRGEAAGPPSDVFSLGATLVFAATGRDLVDDASVYEQVLQIAEGRFSLTDVPSRLRALVVRCVSFHPEDRPTAAELTRFVVALGAVTPGLGVEDVTVKISTKHRSCRDPAPPHPPAPPPLPAPRRAAPPSAVPSPMPRRPERHGPSDSVRSSRRARRTRGNRPASALPGLRRRPEPVPAGRGPTLQRPVARSPAARSLTAHPWRASHSVRARPAPTRRTTGGRRIRPTPISTARRSTSSRPGRDGRGASSSPPAAPPRPS